jgi:hypothetical protein
MKLFHTLNYHTQWQFLLLAKTVSLHASGLFAPLNRQGAAAAEERVQYAIIIALGQLSTRILFRYRTFSLILDEIISCHKHRIL